MIGRRATDARLLEYLRHELLGHVRRHVQLLLVVQRVVLNVGGRRDIVGVRVGLTVVSELLLWLLVLLVLLDVLRPLRRRVVLLVVLMGLRVVLVLLWVVGRCGLRCLEKREKLKSKSH